MQVFSTKHKEKIFFQIYLTEEELKNDDIQKKITEIKGRNTKIAFFVSGNNNYLKILEKIILSEVEKINGLWYNDN